LSKKIKDLLVKNYSEIYTSSSLSLKQQPPVIKVHKTQVKSNIKNKMNLCALFLKFNLNLVILTKKIKESKSLTSLKPEQL